MGVAIPLDKMSRKEKILAMESLWDDLCQHAKKVQSPEWHATVLGQREESLRVGEAEFSDWGRPKNASGKSASDDQDS